MKIKSEINKYLLNFRYAFRIRKPLLILRLVKTFLGILLFKKKPLRYVDFAIGYSCNLKCEHCFATALVNNKRSTLMPSQYKPIVEQAMKLGAVNFSFQGGEPTMYNSLVDIVMNSHPERNLISITTNGTLLDEEKIKRLKKAGVDILTISLDSAIAQEHDRFRGVTGTFQKTMNTIKLALKNGLNVTIGAVVSHENIKTKGLTDLIELAHDLNVIIFLALAVSVGQWKNKDIMLTDNDREYLYSLLKKYPLLRTDFEANYIHWGCGAVKEILYITPYGDVLPCPFLHFSLGNVFDESLSSIRDKAMKNEIFDHYHHLCLAAEDKDFIAKNKGYFYKDLDNTQDSVRKLKDLL